jgi:hypothetical protein
MSSSLNGPSLNGLGRFDGKVHLLPVNVYYEDTDLSGFVYHANYLKFMERGRTEFFRLAGVSKMAGLEDAEPTAWTLRAIAVGLPPSRAAGRRADRAHPPGFHHRRAHPCVAAGDMRRNVAGGGADRSVHRHVIGQAAASAARGDGLPVAPGFAAAGLSKGHLSFIPAKFRPRLMRKALLRRSHKGFLR